MTQSSGKSNGGKPKFPPRAKAASFTVGDAMEKITTASPSQN